MLTVLNPEDTVSILGGNLVFGGNGKSLVEQENNLILGGNIFDGSNGTSLVEQGNNLINSGNISDGNNGNILLNQRNNVINSGNIFDGSNGNILLNQGNNVINGKDVNNSIDASQFSSGVSITADLEAQTISLNNVPVLGTLTFKIANIANVIGTNNADSIKGDSQNNQLTGLADDDLIDGGLGNDVIDGGLGNDTLIGGAGDDTFNGSRGNDSINGGDGFDKADYSKLGQAITLSGVGAIIKAGGFGTDQVFKVETVIADASVADNSIDASQSLSGVSATANLEAQTISASNVPGLGTLAFNVVNFDNLIGTNESDSITGDSQDNRLVGNAGNDTIIGGLGNDTIIGGEGNDVLTGGFGADKFIFNSAKESLDIIKDYNFAQGDVIQVSKVGFGTTNSSDFLYDTSSGKLSFLGNQFAFVENLSSNVSIQLV
ncbi:Ca2+-binding protein, RTX toxin-related [Nostoc flagelliforme CCNUN1]|uniref:Ca2+-binding protein, RTX toxin-related n=1 Tax=Nostoc flagelliforme CCNUN1 TaxID=2038116 RepID=A0A2K8SID3_9NOSO|nr:calcium-binding protein [Nostoc flagelliforme]AUB34605.1 Ca2+-binding protein, RTX toxin-related [Nostoc flagelliforme CCNUN1]